LVIYLGLYCRERENVNAKVNTHSRYMKGLIGHKCVFELNQSIWSSLTFLSK